MNNDLTPREKRLIEHTFVDGGYVLDFSNATFEDFTVASVNRAIQAEYGESKGRSLMTFFNKATNHEAGKLLKDLVERKFDNEKLGECAINNMEKKALSECCQIVERLIGSNHSLIIGDALITSSFNSEYIETQVLQMNEQVLTNPTDAIGKAKELLESCFKTILFNRGIAYTKKEDFPELMKKTLKELKIDRDSVPKDKKASETIKKILSNLQSVILEINTLRNSYGSGHGRTSGYTGLTARHAKLAVGSAVTAVQFLWETHELTCKKQ